MRTMCRIGIAILTTVAALAAQQDEGPAVRRPTFARVLGGDGEPLAGAVVTFAGCVPHVGTVVGPHDVQVVAADARGRAQAKLREGLCYVAWAAAEVDGQRLVADAIGYFGAGALLELVCRPGAELRRVQVLGAEAWAAEGPLRLFATTPTPGVEDELAFVDGAVEVPAVPKLQLEVRTADGRPLWQFLAPADTVVIPPPQTLAVRVVDENGAPLPGATLTQRVGRRSSFGVGGFVGTWDHVHRPLGAVGADGTATVTICSSGDLLRDASVRDVLLFASAPGRPSVAGGRFHDRFYVDDKKVAAPPESVLPFTLIPVEPLVGWVGVVPAGTVAHLSAVCKLFSSESSYYHDTRSFVVPVGPDGRVAFAELPADVHSCHLTLLSADGELRALPLLPGLSGRELPFAGAPTEAAGARVPACDLTLQVTDLLGGPARGMVVALVPGDLAGVLVRDAAVQLPLDAGGSVSLRLVTGRWHVMAVTETAWMVTTLDLDAGERREVVGMQPLQRMHLRLTDAAGQPVVGAAPVPRGTSTVSTGDPMQPLLQHLQHALRAAWTRLRTDRDGRLAVPFVPVEGVTNRLRLDLGDRRTEEFALEAGEGPFELRLP